MLENAYWVLVGVLVGVIIHHSWFIRHLQSVHEKTQKDLLDRIMVKDYATYINGEVVREQAKQPQPPVYEEERGIPI
jgi:hypothetical protein